MRRDAGPTIRWQAVLAGGATAVLVSLAVSLVGTASGATGLVLLGALAGVTAGGTVAGRLSRDAGAFQGGMVAVLWILAQALSDTLAAPAGEALPDLVLIVLSDAVFVATGALFGWLGARLAPPAPTTRRSR